MRTARSVTLIGLLAGVLVATALGAERRIILRVDHADLAWGKSHLSDLLTSQLGWNNDLRITPVHLHDPNLPPFPAAGHDPDSLLHWGREVGGDYLLSIVVHSENLERKKSFSIPLILHKWETVAVIGGEIRLLDLKRGRMLMAKPFHEMFSGRKIILADSDNNRDDPDLHIPASQKGDLFYRLEERLAGNLAKHVKSLIRSR